MCGGRTRPSRDVAIETIVEVPTETASSTTARFETRTILDLAQHPISVAEIATEMRIPLGTTLVLIADLLESADLMGHETAAQSKLSNLEIMTRIIHRVREL